MKNHNLFALALLLFAAPAGAADVESLYGPRIELGGGAGYSSESSRMDWGSNSYTTGMITGSFRLFRGFALQGGMDYGRGATPKIKSLTYGDRQLNLGGKVYQNSNWAGVRYELPLSHVGWDFLGMYSIYIGAGMCWTEYGVKSSSWTIKGRTEESEQPVQYNTANLRGPYAIAAARWRVEPPGTEGSSSWAGSFGLDFGVRYNKFGTSSVEHPNIAVPPDDYRSVQIFALLLMKFRVFE